MCHEQPRLPPPRPPLPPLSPTPNTKPIKLPPPPPGLTSNTHPPQGQGPKPRRDLINHWPAGRPTKTRPSSSPPSTLFPAQADGLSTPHPPGGPSLGTQCSGSGTVYACGGGGGAGLHTTAWWTTRIGGADTRCTRAAARLSWPDVAGVARGPQPRQEDPPGPGAVAPASTS